MQIGNFPSLREPLEKRKDLQALTFLVPTKDNLVLDPKAVLHLVNWLYDKKEFALWFEMKDGFLWLGKRAWTS